MPRVIYAAHVSCAVRSVDVYEKINKIEEGTYGVVFRAKVRETGCDCCRHDIIDIYQL